MTHESVWAAPQAPGPLDASVQIPGSKSLTNRYLVLAALASSPSRIRRPLFSRDTRLMMEALTTLGASVETVAGDGQFGPDLLVTPLDRRPSAPLQASVDCGLAGTVMRFVPLVAALVPGTFHFDGDASAYARPLGPVLDALRTLGVSVQPANASTLPFTMTGDGHVTADSLAVDGSASSQFISALLLVASQFERGLTLTLSGETLVSPDHVLMSVEALRFCGVPVTEIGAHTWQVAPCQYPGFDVQIEPDLSNAGPFIAAAVLAGGEIRVDGWPEHSTQVGMRWPHIVESFGATTDYAEGTLVIRSPGLGTPGALRPAEVADASELAPTVAAIAAAIPGTSRLTGIAHLRGHETNRLEALATEFNACGITTAETPDGLVITGGTGHGALFHSYHDHRMATAGAILGLVVDGMKVLNVETTAKTLPDFTRLWADLLAQRSVLEGGGAHG